MSGLAAAEAAQDRIRAHLSRHPRDPHALPAGVHVDVVLVRAALLDRDPEDRVRPEDGDPRKTSLSEPPPTPRDARSFGRMPTVTELDVPRFDYTDPELRGDRFHETMR